MRTGLRRLGWVMLRGPADILPDGDEHDRAQNLLRLRYPQYRAMNCLALPVIAVRIRSVLSMGCAGLAPPSREVLTGCQSRLPGFPTTHRLTSEKNSVPFGKTALVKVFGCRRQGNENRPCTNPPAPGGAGRPLRGSADGPANGRGVLADHGIRAGRSRQYQWAVYIRRGDARTPQPVEIDQRFFWSRLAGER